MERDDSEETEHTQTVPPSGGTQDAVVTSPVQLNVELSEEDTQKNGLNTTLSPKIARPKLPDFKENGQIRSGLHGRAKTDPGQGSHIKAIIDRTVEDIKELNQVDFTKTFGRPKKFPKPFAPKSQSTHTSPRASPTPSEETGPSPLNRNRSRSLRVLTDILKGGRGGSSEYRIGNIPRKSVDDSTSKSISDSQLLPRKPSSVKEEDRRSISDGQLQANRDENKSENSNSSGTPDSGATDSGHEKASSDTPELPSPVEDSKALIKRRNDMAKFRRAKSEARKVNISDDEGVGISDQDLSHSSTTYKPHSIDTNSKFFTLWKIGAPKRRTGLADIVKRVQSTHCRSADDSHGENILPGIWKLPRVELKPIQGVRKSSSLRHVTHPPQSKTTFREPLGAMDSNGFGMLAKTPEHEELPPFPGDLESKTSDLSLTDSQAFQSESGDEAFRTFEDDEISETQSNAGDDKPTEKRKLLKPKSKSDPSGDKCKDNMSPVCQMTSSHSSPHLSKSSEIDLEDMEDDRGEKNNKDLSLNLPCSALTPSSSFDDGPLHFEVPEDSVSNQRSDGALTPELEQSQDLGRFTSVFVKEIAPPPKENNESTTDKNSLGIPYQTKKNIGRSVSSASVLQRERKFPSVTKDEPRKHSLSQEEAVKEAKHELVPLADSQSQSTSMPALAKKPSKDKRYHIVEELCKNEQEYVDALTVLKDKYMLPLKTSCSSVDENLVDNIFYMIPEILMHHTVYRNALDRVWTNWDSETSTMGNVISATFSKQTVIDCYLSFVENYKTSGKVIENALTTKSSVQKFIEQCHKESGNKLSMKDLIVRPIQRIPRYELLLQRLIEHTPPGHPDFPLLKEAEKVMHDFAIKLGTVNESQHEEDQQATLKRLELLLITDLAVPDRQYIRHDMVQIMSKKDQWCIWTFSDLIIISSLKRRSGPVTRKSIILKSTTGQDFTENIKHKVWLKVGLDAVEIVKSPTNLSRRNLVDPEQLEEDIGFLNEISDLTNRLNCPHSSLEEIVKDMLSTLNKQLSEAMLRNPTAESNKVDILVTTQEAIYPLEIMFSSGEKRIAWEAAVSEAKQKLAQMFDKRAPEFLTPLPITKTRAGMQFSCAAPIDGVNNSGYREVWVCNSDGYVGHMCLLSLQPEPIVTLNTPVPGCNARILCICAVPAYSGNFRRKSSGKRHQHPVISQHPVIASVSEDSPQISIDDTEEGTEDGTEEEEEEKSIEDKSDSESESSDEETETPFPSMNENNEDPMSVDDEEGKIPPPADLPAPTPDPVSPNPDPVSSNPDPIIAGSWIQDSLKSTMWLGTEDGCIHVFQCTDNIKTTKNKLKIHHESPVYCIVYLDNKVFASLANGDLIVYKRDSEGIWDAENPYTRSIGTAQSPINKMLAVAGKLWCGCQNVMKVINPLTLSTETSFQATSDSERCIQCLVCSGQGVWMATQQSSKLLLYHATSYEFLLEVSIAQAVAQKLQSADDIIRQHKAACLRITALMVCKDLLWVGTSAGVILTITMPRITSTTTRGSIPAPTVTGLVNGHTGHVRFLTCVEMTVTPPTVKVEGGEEEDGISENLALHGIHRRSSMAATTTLASRMLVISGGDGYEDFRNNAANESAGRDDSTNHLLIWQV
ncbi:rho guanine nucleotide exchange factor 17-like [Saccostrea echinata]|uniref:rho guanine nucleotide exchange factor 17-like n=2 Tax=Saccostrea echinata TaxID=191078 RepID=UPI002A82C0E6|nr:rho guanine nucleotide exchange factor 17-like [Saccostrea echinata]